nr:YbjQ family protein [uncultured Halomonas sp.]
MSERMIVTTSSHLEGYRITEHLDIVSAECVFGMNVFKDMFAGFRDFFGGRNKSSQNALRDARKTCLDELRKEAESLGANAVIGIDLDYSEISGDGKSMLFLVATGTAVKVVKV